MVMELSTSMSYRIKELLLRAWRERWSEIDFGRNIKRLLPRGVSGDVYELAECIMRQAVTGPVPNTLMMSYLNHCLGAQVVSFGAVIHAITKMQDPKPSCTLCLLEFIHKYRTRISCYGNEDECIALCRALISLLHWLYQITSNSIDESVKSSSSTPEENAGSVNSQILQLSSEVLSHLMQSSFLKTLLYVGKLDEPLLWMQFIKQYKEVTAKITMITDRSNDPIFQVISSFQNSIEWLDASINSTDLYSVSSAPVISVAIKQLTSYSTYIQYRPIAYRCLQAAISFGAVLERFNTAEVMANQIAMIGRYFDIGPPQIYCETLHACFVSLIEAQKLNMENPKFVNYFHKWVAFFLFKLPQVFLCLSRQQQSNATASTDFEAGLDLLMQRSPLLDRFAIMLPGEYLPKFIDELEKISLLSAKASEKFLHSRKMTKLPAQTTAEIGHSVLVVRAEITLITVLESFQSDDPETLLGILCRMHNSLEVMLCTSACTGSLSKFAQKLVTLNESSKVSSGESLRTSQMRAILFDISFLLLCSLVQNFGSEVITNQPDLKDSFFANWCSVNFTEDLSPDTIVGTINLDATKLDPLLTQLIVSNSSVEFKTSLVRWNDVCAAVQIAINEILSAWTHDALPTETVKVFLERIKSKLCFPSVVASCLLIAQLKTASQEQSEKIMNMLTELKIPYSEESDSTFDAAPDSLMMFYKERSVILQGIMKHLFNKYLPHTAVNTNDSSSSSTPISKSTGFSPAIPLRLSRSSLNDMLKNTLDATEGHFIMQNIYDFDGLMALGGARWFTNCVVASLFDQIEIDLLQQAVDMAYGLFHLDLEQCALVLLRDTIPRVLLFKTNQDNLSEPRVTALVRLAIMTTFGAISHLQSLTKSGLSRRSAHRREYEDSSQEWQLGSFNPEMLKNTAYSYELQAKQNGTVTANPNDDSFMEVNGGDDGNENKQLWEAQDGYGDLIQEPLFAEFVRFLNLLLDISLDSEYSPRLMVSMVVLEQIILCLRDDSHQFLQFVPFHLMDGIIRSTYDVLTYNQLLAYLSLDSVRARKIGARLLCQLHLSKGHGV